jgi:glycosyltransferase involved in cell wall biosynthesis
MLDIGLCMTVKDEADNIVDCLSGIVDLFAQVVIIDTGSTDGTRELLRDRLGIEPLFMPLDPDECCALSSPRNLGFDRLSTPWLLTLDADERLDRAELEAVISLGERDLPAGVMFGWDTSYGPNRIVEDYKLILFRRHHRHRGLVHDTAQPSLRETGELACWSPLMRIRHYPNLPDIARKDDWYAWRLDCARRREPDWLRYHWFSGYRSYRLGHEAEAEALMRTMHDGRPPLFPVESLNASMVLAAIHAARGEQGSTEAVLAEALRYHRQVADDFEIKVNFRLRPWFEDAAEKAARGNLDTITPYPFPY